MMELLSRPAVRRVLTPLKLSRRVHRPLRFVIGELSGRPVVRRHRLRGSGLTVTLRHPHVDLWVLDEIFERRVYEPPVEVLDRLDRLGRPPRVLDVGACAGLAGAFFLGRFPGARVVALEPDAENASLLRDAIAANEMDGSWSLVQAAAAATDGTADFVSDHFLSHVVRAPTDRDTTTVRTVDVFPYLRDADLVKMDVQGSEWALLSDERFAETSACAIVLEYHPEDAPSADARTAATELLGAAGFRVHPVVVDEHLGEGTMWAFRDPPDDRA